MFNLLVLLAVILSLIIIGGAILVGKSQTDKQKQPENRPIMDNFEPQLTDGHSLGVVKDMKFSENRIMIEFLPRDYNLPKETKEDKNFKVKTYKIFFDKRQVDIYSGWSSHVPRIMAFPDSADKVPQEILQKFPEIIGRIERNNQIKDASDVYKTRMENLIRVAKLTTGGELFRKEAIIQKEFLKDRTELNINLKKEDDKK